MVMNQKSSPSGADCVGAVETAGMLPVGTNRILEVVRERSAGTAREICDRLYRAVADCAQRDSLDDDLTVMVLKLKDNPGCPYSRPFFY
jgi:hypothetical protein